MPGIYCFTFFESKKESEEWSSEFGSVDLKGSQLSLSLKYGKQTNKNKQNQNQNQSQDSVINYTDVVTQAWVIKGKPQQNSPF